MGLASSDRRLDAAKPIVQARVLDGTVRLTAVIEQITDHLSRVAHNILKCPVGIFRKLATPSHSQVEQVRSHVDAAIAVNSAREE